MDNKTSRPAPRAAEIFSAFSRWIAGENFPPHLAKTGLTFTQNLAFSNNQILAYRTKATEIEMLRTTPNLIPAEHLAIFRACAAEHGSALKIVFVDFFDELCHFNLDAISPVPENNLAERLAPVAQSDLETAILRQFEILHPAARADVLTILAQKFETEMNFALAIVANQLEMESKNDY